MSATVVQTEEEGTVSLTANDRCDACGAQAYIRAEMLDSELLFCAHHFTKSEQAIRDASILIHDERHRLA